jgi:hypothetical protein
MSRRPRGSSKWFDAVIVETSSKRIANKHAGAEHQPMKPLRYRNIKPSAMQAKVIAACLAEVDELMAAFRLPPARITADRVHILSRQDFVRLVGHDRFWAVSVLGHVYLNARYVRRIRDLAIILSHELAHAASFTALIYRRGMPMPLPLVGLQASAVHLGRLDRASFGALNEVTTEMAAHSMRLGLVEKGIVQKKDAEYVTNYWRNHGYAPLSIFLITQLRPTPAGIVRLQRRLVHSMLTGGKSFFSMLRRRGLLEKFLELPNDPSAISQFMQ